MLAKIIKVFPIVHRDYTDRLGAKQQFHSKGFLINAGEGTIYVEAIQETATALESFGVKEDSLAFVQLMFSAREYKTAQGESKMSNEVTLKQFIPV